MIKQHVLPFKRKLFPKESPIFTAEAHAIDLALIISESKYKNFIIFLDSLIVLQSLRNKKLEDPLSLNS